MLNYFLIYPMIWGMVLILYCMNFSLFNIAMDPFLLLFIIASSIISLFLGIWHRKKFKFKKDPDIKLSVKPLIFIFIFMILEFIIVKDIPFISIAILKTQEYSSLKFAPFIHVVVAALGMYYAIKYFYCAICNKQNRKKSILCFIAILIIFLLYYARSFIAMILFAAMIMLLSYLSSENRIKFKHIIISIVSVIVLLYGYGGLGNIRQGYTWNDSSYIETIGLYTKYPKFLPKQFMWPYSYFTTPLANLNYNVKKADVSIKPIAIVGEMVPKTISKRLTAMSDSTSCQLIKSYFNVSTGYCSFYVNGSFVGLIILFGFMILLGLLGTKMSNIEKLKSDYIIFCSMMCIVYLFMFFDNMFSYVGVSIPFWISFVVLLLKAKKIKKAEKLEENLINE